MATLDDFVTNFELLGDWEQRYQYLIELGEKLPAMDSKFKIMDNKVKGCMSQVWIHAVLDDSNRVHYSGDSDTSIIKGVVALLIALTQNKSIDDIQHLDMDEIFTRLNLHEHLSPNRHVGIYAIVTLMQQQARQLKHAA